MAWIFFGLYTFLYYTCSGILENLFKVLLHCYIYTIVNTFPTTYSSLLYCIKNTLIFQVMKLYDGKHCSAVLGFIGENNIKLS